MNFKAVVFDLDGVIVSTDALHYLASKRLADKLSIYFDHAINDRLRGVRRMESLEIILEKSQIHYPENEKMELAARKNQYYRGFLEELVPSDILPHVIESLKLLKQQKYLLGIASSSKNAKFILEKNWLTSFFRRRV